VIAFGGRFVCSQTIVHLTSKSGLKDLKMLCAPDVLLQKHNDRKVDNAANASVMIVSKAEALSTA
jgi:hypothetical protein